jgi:hypothetical protein
VLSEAKQEAIQEMVALWAQRKPLRAITAAMSEKGHRVSNQGVADIVRAASAHSQPATVAGRNAMTS